MTHLGLGSSLEEPWGAYCREGGSVTFPGGSINLLGGLDGPMVGGHLLPCLEALVGLLT